MQTKAENLINALECCLDVIRARQFSSGCGFCPYMDIEHCKEKMIEDTIELLKEQEAKTGHWIVLDNCANEGIYCSECTNKIFDHATKPKKKLSQYCPHCGSRNEQFFKDGMVVFR